MMKEVLLGTENGGADFAIADLSVTSSRASAVTFSMPFMNLGEQKQTNIDKYIISRPQFFANQTPYFSLKLPDSLLY
jgi:hypothetical protein